MCKERDRNWMDKYGTISLHLFILYYLSVIRQEDGHSLVIRKTIEREKKQEKKNTP